MPTPVRAFAEVAARRGGVDASDLEQVQRFYRETLPTLEPRVVYTILEELLSFEGRAEGTHPDPTYPPRRGRPLPLHASPPVPLPLLACGWRARIARLLRRSARGP